MDKEIISQWAEAHREEFLEDIKSWCGFPLTGESRRKVRHLAPDRMRR